MATLTFTLPLCMASDRVESYQIVLLATSESWCYLQTFDVDTTAAA